MSPVLRVKKLTDLAILPTRGSSLAAGFDLSSAYDAIIPANGKGLVKTDLCIAVPNGCYARVAPRSGLALKKFIDTGAGVIDADYRGNVGVVLFNHANEAFEIKRGDRVAQLILEKIEYAEIEVVQELEETARGAGGFGSTGVDIPLKRMREESDKPSNKENDTVYTALQQLFASGVISDNQRLLVKTLVMKANDRQYAMLCQAMTDFLHSNDQGQALEWITAFLEATQSTTLQP